MGPKNPSDYWTGRSSKKINLKVNKTNIIKKITNVVNLLITWMKVVT